MTDPNTSPIVEIDPREMGPSGASCFFMGKEYPHGHEGCFPYRSNHGQQLICINGEWNRTGYCSLTYIPPELRPPRM